MKKIVGIILGLAVVAAVGFYFLRPGGKPAAGYARFLPPDVVTTVNLTHGSTLMDNFAASAMGRMLAKDTIHAIAQEMGGKAKDLAEYDRAYDSVTAVANDPAFRAVFGDDATLALLAPDRKVLVDNPGLALGNSLVVLAKTSVAGALDMLTRLITHAQISRETVDGLDLVKITLDQGPVFYGYTEGPMVFLAMAPAAIKTCLAAGKGEAALDKAPAFQEAVAYWQTFPATMIYSRSYLNTPLVAELLKLATVPEVKEAGELLTGIGVAYSIDYGTGQGMEGRGRANLTYDRLHPALKGLFDSVKGNQTLHLLQDKALAYSWDASLQFQMERIIAAAKAEGQEYQNIDQQVRQFWGVSVEELVHALGSQCGGVLDDVVRTPLFPWPKMTLFIEVRDRAVIEKALNGMRNFVAAQGSIREEQEQVEGQTVYSWPVMPGEVQPAAVLTDNMFYLSTSKQSLKAMLAAKAAPGALAAPVTAQLGPDLSGRVKASNLSNFVVFPARMARQTGETIEWLAAILASRQVGMERLKRELVQLMESTELIAVTTQVSKERTEWAMTTVTAKKPAAGGGQ